MVDGGIKKPTARFVAILFAGWVGVFGAIVFASGADAETAKPLPPQDCQSLRLALESNLPFGPGFRRLEVQFPKNSQDLEGHVC